MNPLTVLALFAFIVAGAILTTVIGLLIQDEVAKRREARRDHEDGAP
jgi:hypothetical protein